MAKLTITFAGHAVIAVPQGPTKGECWALLLGREHTPTLAVPVEAVKAIDPEFPRPACSLVSPDAKQIALLDISGYEVSCVPDSPAPLEIADLSAGLDLNALMESKGDVRLSYLLGMEDSKPIGVAARFQIDRGQLAVGASSARKYGVVGANGELGAEREISITYKWYAGEVRSLKLKNGLQEHRLRLHLDQHVEITAFSLCGWAGGEISNTLDLGDFGLMLNTKIATVRTKDSSVTVDEETCPPGKVGFI